LWGALPAPLGTDARAVPYYTGRVYPTPQFAEYRDAWIPLDNAVIVPGKGIAPDDARIALLRERIARYGGAVRPASAADAPGSALILVGETGLHADLLKGRTVPEKPEGYLLHAAAKDGKAIVFLKGRDAQGLLWAVTAFNQLVTAADGRAAARAATILDFPDAPGKRAYTSMNDNDAMDSTWFAIHNLRPNVVIYRMGRQMFGKSGGTWRQDSRTHGAAWRAKIDKAGALLTPLGIEWYDCILPNFSTDEKDPAKNRQIRSKSDEDFEILRDLALYCAERGGNFGLLYDDFRFPIHPDDARDFGSAREADIYFINKLYSAVAAKHPNFKLLFCPPFYWGPASDPGAAYGESREEYLSAIGKRLPQAVEIYWSGPRVKSGVITPQDLQWFTDLTGRKPVIWQNVPGTYHGSVYYVYPTDALTAWHDWYFDGFFDRIAFYAFNSSDEYTHMTLFDAMWNRKAYDPAASGAEAARKLVGPDAYPALVEGFKRLEAMDEYGWFTPTALAARNVEDVRRKTGELLTWFESAPAPLKAPWTHLGMFVGYRKAYLNNLLKNPQLLELTAADERVRALAARETGVSTNAGNLLILTPNDFRAGREPTYYGWKGAERRHVSWINGADSKAPVMEASFQLPYPLTGDSELLIAGLDHNASPPCRIRILMNGSTVFEGPNPFAPDRWSTHSFRVRGAFLRDGVANTLRIENVEPSDSMSGAPWFMLSYAVLRPAP
jgi:hypothetical protein